MHEIAERGFAAHYKYKQGDEKESGLDLWLNRLQSVLEIQTQVQLILLRILN